MCGAWNQPLRAAGNSVGRSAQDLTVEGTEMAAATAVYGSHTWTFVTSMFADGPGTGEQVAGLAGTRHHQLQSPTLQVRFPRHPQGARPRQPQRSGQSPGEMGTPGHRYLRSLKRTRESTITTASNKFERRQPYVFCIGHRI